MTGDELRLVSGRWDHGVLGCTTCMSTQLELSLFAAGELLVLCANCHDTVATSPPGVRLTPSDL